MIAYNDESLVDSSFWNGAVIVLLALSAFFYLRFIKQYQDKLYYMPNDFCTAFKNDGKLFKIIRWCISGFVVLAGIALLMQCEIDKNANFLRVVAVMGILSGICFGLSLTSANRPAVFNQDFAAFLSFVPILFMAIWLVALYKENSINPVSWDYIVELYAIISAMFAFFRLAGFAFKIPNVWRSLFFSMTGASSCIMNLADERYIGEQLFFAGVAMMLLMYTWILLDNLVKGKPEEKDISI